jgi:RNA polymerase sigma-70 factor (ECF subfamily)
LLRCDFIRGNRAVPRATYIVENTPSKLPETGLGIDWNAIVRDYGPGVYGCAWRILGQSTDAEDVTQEVFMEAYKLHHSQSVRSWAALLRRLAVCRALDRVRRRRPTLSINGLPLAASNSSPESDAMAAELAERLPEAISRLPEREGEVFCLRYFEDLSNQQIADALDMQAGAVAVALHKARAKLEALLHLPLQGEKT